jgi:hypothetical protein
MRHRASIAARLPAFGIDVAQPRASSVGETPDWFPTCLSRLLSAERDTPTPGDAATHRKSVVHAGVAR